MVAHSSRVPRTVCKVNSMELLVAFVPRQLNQSLLSQTVAIPMPIVRDIGKRVRSRKGVNSADIDSIPQGREILCTGVHLTVFTVMIVLYG